MKIGVKRFKLEDGREGSYASLGNGLIKLLFDDGSMVIALGESTERDTDGADETQGEEEQ